MFLKVEYGEKVYQEYLKQLPTKIAVATAVKTLTRIVTNDSQGLPVCAFQVINQFVAQSKTIIVSEMQGDTDRYGIYQLGKLVYRLNLTESRYVKFLVKKGYIGRHTRFLTKTELKYTSIAYETIKQNYGSLTNLLEGQTGFGSKAGLIEYIRTLDKGDAIGLTLIYNTKEGWVDVYDKESLEERRNPSYFKVLDVDDLLITTLRETITGGYEAVYQKINRLGDILLRV